jgi:1,4-alpha-glucan branching enzyme
MLQKVYSQTGRKCRVTFVLHPAGSPQTVSVCGEFNHWNPSTHPLKRRKNGSFAVMMWLEAGQQYRFRYLLDGEHWENDPAADAYAANPYGGEDSILAV